MKNTLNTKFLSASILSVAISAAVAPQMALAKQTPFQSISIQAQPLQNALVEIGLKYDVVVVASNTLTEGKYGNIVEGRFSAIEAIKALLKGSGLDVKRSENDALIIVALENPTNDKPQKQIEKISVTGYRIDTPSAKITNQITVISESEIKQAITVSDSMSGVLETTLPGYSGSTSSQTLRGISLRGGNPLILIDGIPQFVSMFDSNKEANTIDMDFVSNVEVIHGATARQGIGGTGGIINLVTKTPSIDDGFSQDLTFRLSFDDSYSDDSLTKKVAYTAGLNKDNLSFMFGYARNDRGMSYDANGDIVGLVRYSGSLADTLSENFMFKGSYVNDVHSINVMHSTFKMEGKRGWSPVAGCHPTRCEVADVKLQSAERGWDDSIHALPGISDNTATSIDYINEDLFSWKLVGQYYLSNYDYRFTGTTSSFFDDNNPPENITAQTSVKSDKDGFKLTLSKEIIDNVQATFGYDSSSENTTQFVPQNGMSIIPPTKLSQSSPFVYLNWDATEKLRFNLGLRHVNSEVSMPSFTPAPYYLVRGSGPVTGGKVDSNDTVKNFGLIYDLTKNLSFYSNFTEGFELAEVGRVLRANGVEQGVTLSNDYLAISPNIHENLEYGMRYNDGTTSFEANVFEQNAPFGNSYMPNEDGLLEISRMETQRSGYNLILTHKLTSTFDFGLSYSVADAKSDSDGNGSFETDLVSLSVGAPDQYKLYLNYDLGDWYGKFSWVKYKDKDFEGTEYAFKGYHIGNISVSRYIGDNSTVSLAVKNLFNEEYIDLYSQISGNNNWYVAGVGRTINLAFNTKF